MGRIMITKIAGTFTFLLAMTSAGAAFAQCEYTQSDGYAHVVSVPSYAIVSVNRQHQNVRLTVAAFPEKPEPGQVYTVKIKEPTSPQCKQVHFEIIKRVQ